MCHRRNIDKKTFRTGCWALVKFNAEGTIPGIFEFPEVEDVVAPLAVGLSQTLTQSKLLGGSHKVIYT